jgi:hypothetical protein
VHADEKPLIFGSFAAFEQAVRSSLRGDDAAAAA